MDSGKIKEMSGWVKAVENGLKPLTEHELDQLRSPPPGVSAELKEAALLRTMNRHDRRAWLKQHGRQRRPVRLKKGK